MNKQNIAYTKRDIINIKKKKNRYLRLKQFINKQRKKHNFTIDSKKYDFILYPEITTEKELIKLIKRLNFSLPKKEKSYIKIPVSKKLYKENLKFREDIILFSQENFDKENLSNIILVHNMTTLPLSILRNAHKIEIIDNLYFSDIEAETMRRIFYYSFNKDEKNEFLSVSKDNFNNFLEENKKKDTAYCFTSGPSFDTYKDIPIDNNSLKVICNSIVKNKDFLDYIGGADIIAFADPVFHFGPSEYAETFRKDVITFLENSNAYAIIPDYNLPLMIYHYPKLKNKLIGMPTQNKEFNFPSSEKFYVKGSANILTLFMLPIASSISNKIFMIGADGRKKDEKYFWKHSSAAQYDDEMESAFETHPSFFRDRNYEDYYEEHCDFLENLINFGNISDKVYSSLTNSYIPVLEKYSYNLNKSKNENMIILKNLQEKEKNKTSIKLENIDFSKKINILFKHIQIIKDNNFKIAIYGYGIIGKLLEESLKEQVVMITDRNINLKTEVKNFCKIEEIDLKEFDKLVICVLGREEEIIKKLNIDNDKIYLLNLDS